MSVDPRALIETGFDAFNRLDLPAVLEILHPEVESRVLEPLMNAGTWNGHAGFGEMIQAWLEPWQELQTELLSVQLPDDSNAVATVRQTAIGRASGVPVTLDVFFLFELRDDLAIRLQIHPSLDSALAAV